MTIYIAFLRGINVGGHNMIKMAELKQLFETMGFSNVKTYIQSGNVLFESGEKADHLVQRIEQEIKAVFGFSITVVLRTSTELEQIIKNCPFAPNTLSEGESIHVSLLIAPPSQEGIEKLASSYNDIDEYQIVDQEVYQLFHQSIRNSKLSINLQKLGVAATARNWKTMNKLNEIAKTMVVG